jgi:hypothetical protein
VLKYKISVTDERQFAGETFEERKARVLSCTETITTKYVPLFFFFRSEFWRVDWLVLFLVLLVFP